MKKILVIKADNNDSVNIEVRKEESSIGRRRRYKGRSVYLAKEVDGQLVPFDPKAESFKRKKELVDKGKKMYSPQELYDALDWRLAEDVYTVRNTTLEKLHTGLMIALVGILCFFIYLLMANIGGW